MQDLRNQQAAKGELPSSFDLNDGEERIGRIYLKGNFAPKPGHFFSSKMVEDWEIGKIKLCSCK